jgi:hypothetical protein
MSIIANKVKVEGNSIFITSNPTTGILALTSFVDNVSGEAGAVNFTKSFRYSINGVTFSEWLGLTSLNITSIQVSQKDTLIIELQYFKNQPAGTDTLDVTTATIGTTNDPIAPGYYFKNSIFYNHFGTEDVEVLNWYINVLDKLYQRGLIPEYIDRLNTFDQPDDFIEFWRSICKFFAYYVAYARKFQNFHESESLLSEYLNERGIITSSENTLNELNHLMEKFYSEIFNRGTIHIIDKVQNGADIDGELLRLIYYKEATDEFILNRNKPEHFGWNLNNSSPLYRGMTIHDNANKFYEQQSEPTDISLYPTTGTASIVNDDNKSVIKLENGAIEDVDGTKKIKVDEYMDYELFFFIKKDAGFNLTVGFDAFDKDGAPINLKSRNTGLDDNVFFFNEDLQRTDKYLAIRVFLYNKQKPIYSGDVTNIQNGKNLKLVAGVTHVIPRIKCTGTAYLYHIRMVPMRTNYSKGFIQSSNFIDCWIKNNNNEFTTEEVKAYVRKYLIPYNSQIEIYRTTDVADYSVEA